MKNLLRAVPILTTALLFLFGFTTASSVSAAKLKVLCAFGDPSCLGGGRPAAGLSEDSSGSLFGTAYYGGLFELKHRPNGKFNFKERSVTGGHSEASPIIDSFGNVYGTALDGGLYEQGVVFEASPSTIAGEPWTEKSLHDFCARPDCKDGATPSSALTYANAMTGALYDGISPMYGVTSGGGHSSKGVVYALKKAGQKWKETIIYSFCSKVNCTDGNSPNGGLIIDASGNIYGTTSAGGLRGNGVVFELQPAGIGWKETVLYDFCSVSQCSDGSFPVGDLAMDASGNLYGVTLGGGVGCVHNESGCGVLFKLTQAGNSRSETVLHAFCSEEDCKDGVLTYQGVAIDRLGNLFGTTEFGGGNDHDPFQSGGGVLYEVSGSTYKVLYSFCALAKCADGSTPDSKPLLDPSSVLYGTTSYGGDSDNGGTVFEFK